MWVSSLLFSCVSVLGVIAYKVLILDCISIFIDGVILLVGSGFGVVIYVLLLRVVLGFVRPGVFLFFRIFTVP